MNVIKRTLTYLLLLVLLAFPFIIYFNAQALTDWWQLHGYTPPASVVQLATDDTMTPQAKHVFYVNHPDLESDSAQFQNNCRESEQTIVLGCYHSNQDGIFIFDITDQRLAGVEQVTAAHEMLHAAYDRLSKSEKNSVNSMLQNYYQNDLHDQRIIDIINSYKQTEPNDVINEMHSIFGSEIANLPAPLETYFSRYFSNRPAVTTYANNYESEFTSREDSLKASAAKLDILKSQIDSDEINLKAQSDRIDTDRQKLNSYRSSGQISQYNAEVAGFNAEVNSYNALVAKTRGEINDFNQIVEEYNATAKELASLAKSIDSRQPQSAQ